MPFRNGLFSCSLDGVSCREVLIFQKSSFMDCAFGVCFIGCAFCVISEMLSPNSKSSRFPPVLPSRRVWILHFPFRCMTYFELMFVKCIKTVSGSRVLHVDPDVLAPSVAELSVLHVLFPLMLYWLFWFFLSFHVNFRISLSISINSLLVFSLELQWIYRSIWEELTS